MKVSGSSPSPVLAGADSRTWLEFEATAKAEPIPVGLGHYNTYSAPGLPGYPGFHGFALRLFDPPDWALADLSPSPN